MRHLSPLLLAAVLLVAQPTHAGEKYALTEFALGTSCAAVNLIYGPVKVAFAVLGTATGALAWVLTGGNREVARSIMQPSLRGDYMITPRNLTFEEPLEFYGRDPAATRW